MMPLYKYMDSFPHQTSQVPFMQYQAFPSHMQVDPTKSPMAYGAWPYAPNYGYPIPCQPCCNHGNFSGYGFRPPYSPMPMPHYGGHPVVYPDAYHVPYAPPHCSKELPRYEYDKNVPQEYHCCGCPNHSCHQKQNTGVKIEEQETDIVEKKENDSLAPIQKNNFPYPIWIPREYFSNEENKLPFGSGVVEQQKAPQRGNDSENFKSSKQEPTWSGWSPLDMNNLRPTPHGGDQKRTKDQEREEQKDFSYPVIWMPFYDNRQDDVGKKGNKDVKSQDEQSAKGNNQFPFPFFWMSPYDNKQKTQEENIDANFASKTAENQQIQMGPCNDDNGLDSGVNEEKLSTQSGKEVKGASSLKIIPVKQIDAPKEKDNTEDTDRRSSSTKQKENEVNKPFGTNARRKSISPPKASKLPPVCLRVDPLPRKKDENRVSRSPSPPGSSKRAVENSKPNVDIEACSKESTLHDSKSHKDTLSNNKEVGPNKKEIKVIHIVEKEGENNIVGSEKGLDVPVSSCLSVPFEGEVSSRVSNNENDGNEANIKSDGEHDVVSKTAEEAMEPKKFGGLAKSADSEGKLGEKGLSEEEAAVVIQSGYRGYMVRRWDPLKKMKQMAEIQEQIVDIRSQIQGLEMSYDVLKDEKQKVVIGETIMRLLLKLDTIQGLHPTLRDVRKSLARELVDLQEKVDSIISEKSQEPIPQELAEERVEEPGVEAEESFVSLSDDGVLHVELDNGERPTELEKVEDLKGTGGNEAFVPFSDERLVHVVSDNERQERALESGGSEIKELNSECTVESKDESSEVQKGEILCEQNLFGEIRNTMDNVLGTSSDASNVRQTCDNLEIEVGQELPIDVFNDGEHVAAAAREVQDAQVESIMSYEAHKLFDQPALSEMKECENVATEKSNDLVDEKGEDEGLSLEKTTLDENKIVVEEWVNVGPEEIKEIPRDSQLEVEARSSEGKEVTHDDIVIMSMVSSEEKESHNIGQEDEATSTVTEEVSTGENEHDVNLPLVEPEKNDQRDISETMKDEVPSRTESTVLHIQKEEEETMLPSSPSCTLKPIDGFEGEFQSDRQIIQENEKLREMLEKLMESGKEQLNVISSLTGRVKELESKLARKKKFKNRQCKISSSSARVKRSNVPMKGRVLDVAM